MRDGYKAGDHVIDFVGPLGMPQHVAKVGHVVLVGGGLGVTYSTETPPGVADYAKAVLEPLHGLGTVKAWIRRSLMRLKDCLGEPA